MNIAAELVQLLAAILPMAPEALEQIESIIDGQTKVPNFDAAAAATRIANAMTAVGSIEAADDATLAARFPSSP